jgi:tetratricopeptide (TPR) repeat protein
LSTAVNDAKTVKDVLLKRYHFDKYHLIELYDEEATRSNILAKLRYLAKRVGPDDSIVIFYAGHGHMDPITKSGSWIPVESSMSLDDTSAWVSNYDIKNYMKVDAIKAKHILLISDSCFSGDFFRGNRGRLPEVTDKVIKRAYERSSRQAITSGGVEPVVDAGFGGNSVFTHFMVQALEENEKPFLIPSDFFPEIKAGVALNAKQFPLFGTLKDTGCQEGGELVFFLKQYGRDDKVKDRQVEIESLKELERQSRAARKKEQAEKAREKEELAKLDNTIKEMKERLGIKDADIDDSLDTMLDMVRKKKNQARRLEELRRKREAEKQKRLAEIERLKSEQERKRLEAIKEDISKYEEIVSSEFGRDMKEDAWNSLVSRYPEASVLAVGDIKGFKLKLLSTTQVGTTQVGTIQVGFKQVGTTQEKEAIESRKQAIRIDPDDAKAHYNLGNAYDELGKYQEAIESHKQAIRIDPDYANAHNNLGIAYGKSGMYEEAIKSFKQAIRIDPDYAYAHDGLGYTFYELGKYQEAIKSYKQAIRIDPDGAYAHYNLGNAYIDSGRHEEAIKSFKQAIRIDPDDADAHYNLGLAYYELGRHEEAIESYKQAIRIDPDDAYAHDGLGYTFYDSGRHEEAIESYKQAIRIDPDYANAHNNLGLAYYE